MKQLHFLSYNVVLPPVLGIESNSALQCHSNLQSANKESAGGWGRAL